MAKKKTTRKTAAASTSKRTRKTRDFPAVPYKQALVLGTAIYKYAAGEKVRRLTLLEKMERSPTSGSTQRLFTNSSKYGITTGSYVADFVELTEDGKIVCEPATPRKKLLETQFKLAVTSIPYFNHVYEEYKGKRWPIQGVVADCMRDGGFDNEEFLDQCIDILVVNLKDLGLLRTLAGAETLIPIEQAIDETEAGVTTPTVSTETAATDETPSIVPETGDRNWASTCFYITPIGSEGSDARKHSDLFMHSLIEPAMDELGLEVVRADKIGNPGMITTNVLEYLHRSRLVIADLSMLNPNVFYEMALRHTCRLPIVQIIQKSDRLPFDVNQVNTVIVDTTDIYTLVPKIDVYRAEIAALSRQALEDPQNIGNPISVFYPAFWQGAPNATGDE